MATVGAWFLCCVCGICVVLCVWVFGTPWSDGVYEWVLLVFACVIFTNGNCLSSAWMLLHE